MISKIRVMIYVDNVESITQFWKTEVGVSQTEIFALPEGYQNIILQITDDFELGLFPKAFIAKYSPEVLDNKPSIMFYTSRFEELHQHIATASEIVEMGGILTFNFSDPEGNTFAVGKL